jgi:hypothetical protein
VVRDPVPLERQIQVEVVAVEVALALLTQAGLADQV